MKLIPLTMGQFATVDDCDYEYFMQWKWHARKRNRTFYAGRNSQYVAGKRKTIFMHNCMNISVSVGEYIDHRDNNGLNCQRSNLRAANHQQNSFNRRKQINKTSKYIGVSIKSERISVPNKWVCQIAHNGIKKHLGYFKTEEQAALKYNAIAHSLFGKYAKLNKIET